MEKILLPVFLGRSDSERNLIKDRTVEGRILTKKRGVNFGRKRKLTNHQKY